jgi:amino acid adenylation domain-containing protein
VGVFIKELLELYRAHCEGRAGALPPLRIQYKDYSNWQQEQLASGQFDEHKRYWLDQFQEPVPVLDLCPDMSRPAIKSYQGARLHGALSTELVERLRALCNENNCTLFMGLVAGVSALLNRYTGQDDIVIGSPVAGRDHNDLHDQIGFYVNTIALRTRIHRGEYFHSLLDQVRLRTLEAYEHQWYPFDDLIDELKLERDMSRSALFSVMVDMQASEMNYTQMARQGQDDFSVSEYEDVGIAISKFDLTFHFSEHDDGLKLEIEYNTDIYLESTVKQLLKHLDQLLHECLLNPSVPLAEIDYLSREEKQELLTDFNDTHISYPPPQNLIDLFEDRVQESPNCIALICEGREMTYGELNARSNAFAHYLRKSYGIKAGNLIGLMLDRSEWLIIGALGILKSGAAYVPIDLEYPEGRIEFMRKDSACKVLFDAGELNEFLKAEALYPTSNLECINKEEDLAYVIYTSGTTGRPKGVMIGRDSLLDYTLTFRNHFGLSPKDRMIQQSSFSFDTHIEEIYPILIAGGILLLTKNGGRDIAELEELIQECGATILSATPIIINELNNRAGELKDLRLLISGGDSFDSSYASHYIRKIEVYNTYGPSESTVCASYARINDGSIPGSIGKPIFNRQIYVLDANQKLCPPGVRGELFIGGKGLSKGYLNQKELSSDRFILNPYSEKELMYRTGDLGKWLPDGTLIFLGRNDEQVKVMGYRIEPAEIERVLLSYDQVEAAVVLAQTSAKGHKFLAAYMEVNQDFDLMHLKSFLGDALPGYMIPKEYIKVKKFPLNANGKLDRQALLRQEKTLALNTALFVAPESELEKTIAGIWSVVLAIEQKAIGVEDNFFELGGNSIALMRVWSALNQKLQRTIPVVTLFRFPDIKSLTIHLGREQGISPDPDRNLNEGVETMEETLSIINN